MTTAHRPTWNAAIGGKNQAGNAERFTPMAAVSGKDLPGMLTLKKRAAGQDTADELARRDLKAELLERERKHLEKQGKAPELASTAHVPRLRDGNVGSAASAGGGAASTAADFDDKDDTDDSEDSDDSDSDSDEEDTAELLRELQKIKAEKAAEAERREAEARAEAEASAHTAVMTGNPLLANAEEGFKVKRRWDDDVVFRHQSRGEPQPKKRFVNDAIRNDFHKKFLAKYIGNTSSYQ